MNGIESIVSTKWHHPDLEYARIGTNLILHGSARISRIDSVQQTIAISQLPYIYTLIN